jgi:hypothetical protein
MCVSLQRLWWRLICAHVAAGLMNPKVGCYQMDQQEGVTGVRHRHVMRHGFVVFHSAALQCPAVVLP